jgi:hypothetical protein
MENPNAMPGPMPGQPMQAGGGAPGGMDESGMPDLPPEQAKTIIAGLVGKLKMMADKYGIDLSAMINGESEDEGAMPPPPPGPPPGM